MKFSVRKFMQLNSIQPKIFINLPIYNTAQPTKNSVNFTGLWEDNYDEGSIFALKAKEERRNDIGNVSEYADYWVKQKQTGSPVTNPELKDLKINSFRDLGNNSYKGGLSSAKNYIDKLKEIGIRKFVILCPETDCAIEELLNKKGMDYDRYFVPMQVVLNSEFKNEIMTDISVRSFVSNLIDMRKGKIFIGCDSGNWRTRRFLSAAKRLDPKSQLPDELLTGKNIGNIQFTKWIYEKMTDAHKSLLGYTPDFEKNLKTLFSTVR